MYALIPHKDTQFFLYNVQKEVIVSYNKECNSKAEFLIPRFPLWAFMDELPVSAISSCIVNGISCTDTELFFGIEIIVGSKASSLKIIVATGENIDKERIKEIDFKEKDSFPLRQRVFRIGESVIEGNNYSLFHDKWVKIK